MENFNFVYAKALYLRFCAIYGDKFVKAYHDDDFKSIWYNEWSTGLAGIDVTLIKGVLETCKLTLEWSPSIAEFRRMCEQSAGVPSLSDALALAIRREFNHPVVSIAYDSVGSWAMKTDKAQELKGKFQLAYTEALNRFRDNPAKTWAMLEESNEQRALPEPPPKIPSEKELIGWRDRFEKYKKMAAREKAELKPVDHPELENDRVKIGYNDFYAKEHAERRKYLTEMDDSLAMTMSTSDQYDRIRFLREDEGNRKVSDYRRGMDDPPTKKTASRGPQDAKTVYKGWMGY